MELAEGLYGALVVCYQDQHEFDADEIARLERLARQTEIALSSVRQRESLSRFAFDTALALTVISLLLVLMAKDLASVFG